MEVALNMEKFRVMGSRLRPIKKNPLKVIDLQGILISVAVRTVIVPAAYNIFLISNLCVT